VPGQRKRNRWDRDWYTISLDTVRGWGIVFTLLVAAALGYFGYRAIDSHRLEMSAGRALAECRLLVDQVEEIGAYQSFLQEFGEALSSLRSAETFFAKENFGASLAAATRSRNLLESILDALGVRGESGEAQFILIRGDVEYRRGSQGNWRVARPRVLLRVGDFVRTADDGSAELMFFDGTLYTMRPGTLFVVNQASGLTSRFGDRVIDLHYGWLNLSTGYRGSEVSTPTALARVEQQTEASISYNRKRNESQFAAYRGSLNIEPKRGGVTRRVGALQQAVERGNGVSEVRPLPAQPVPIEPANNLEIDHTLQHKLRLAWDMVTGAKYYALQVSRNRLFSDNVIDVDKRSKTYATLAVLGEGTFLWRVAAIDRDGRVGPWSRPQKFRVVDRGRRPDEEDSTPPLLSLDQVQSYGSIFIISGRTEPGASVTLNGELVTVEADGTFTRTVQFTEEGWTTIVIRARDPRGNETVRHQRVRVESL
jgi:hypothetical protein